jgi:N-acetylmuramoyl-L-alanine amidase
MSQHEVKPGDTLVAIAWKHGHSEPKTIYDHGPNADLKKRRPNPNLLRPGDALEIPAPKAKSISLATGNRYKITVALPKLELRLTLRGADGKPLANEKFKLELGTKVIEKATDGDGAIKEAVPVGLEDALLTVREQKIKLALGHLEPLPAPEEQALKGVQMRLLNLGYECGTVDGNVGQRTRTALALFQADEDLEITGQPDDATLKKLEERHGS